MPDEMPEVPAGPAATNQPHDAGGRHDPGAGQVTRSIVVDAGLAEVWDAVADPAERALWLDDADAAARHVRIDEATPGHRLVWTWWHPGDENGASTVSVVLAPAGEGGTRVVVTETAPPAIRGVAGATASALAGGGPGLRATAARRAPAWLRCAADRWDGRLLGLELRFVAARALVA